MSPSENTGGLNPRGTPMPQTRILMSEDDKRDAAVMYAMLVPWQELATTMPLQYVMSFLLVAQNEGKGVGDYAEQAGVSSSVMSRHLLDIGARNRHMEPGWGLVDYRPNPLELRKHEYWLTPKGKALFQKMQRTSRGLR